MTQPHGSLPANNPVSFVQWGAIVGLERDFGSAAFDPKQLDFPIARTGEDREAVYHPSMHCRGVARKPSRRLSICLHLVLYQFHSNLHTLYLTICRRICLCLPPSLCDHLYYVPSSESPILRRLPLVLPSKLRGCVADNSQPVLVGLAPANSSLVAVPRRHTGLSAYF